MIDDIDNIDDDDALKAALVCVQAPDPSPALREAITAGTAFMGPANDNAVSIRRRIGALAAMVAIVLSIMALMPNRMEDTAWQEAANGLGVEDIYLWVEDPRDSNGL